MTAADDGLRAALAEALRQHRWAQVGDQYRCACGYVPADTPSIEDHRADALVSDPTVRAAMDRRAAEELRAAARTMPVQDHEMGYAIRNGLEPGPGKWLRERADALAGEDGQ